MARAFAAWSSPGAMNPRPDAASRARPDLSGLNELQKGIAAIRDLMPELDANEALQLVTHNLEAGRAAVLASVDGWQSYRDGLGDAAESARALESNQAELFQSERGFLGAADAARRVSFARIEAEEAQKRQTILDTFGVSERGQQKLNDLELESDTKRRAVIRQFPSFWESQLQAVVNANTFSLGSIVSTWTSGLATAVVQGKSFSETIKAAWQSTATALLQAGLNAAVQSVVQWGIAESTRVAVTEATNTTIVASNVGAAGATTTAWAFATAAMRTGLILLAKGAVGLLGLIVSGVSVVLNSISAVVGFMLATIGKVLIELGTSLQSVPIIGNIIGAILIGAGGASIALGAALPGIVAGITAGLSAGVAALSSAIPALADGGIFTGAALIAEAGTPEVAIPLDQRGKRFMTQLGFGGGAGEQRIIVQVGDDVLTEKVLRGMPRLVRMRVGGALA